MADSSYFAFLYSQNETVAFDEAADSVNLKDPESVQKLFASYLEDYQPPYDIRESLLEDKFYLSENEGDDGDETYLRYDMSIPGIDVDGDAETLKTYLEDFLDKIGYENGAENSYVVEVDLQNNERGGTDIDIYIAVKGPQVCS